MIPTKEEMYKALEKRIGAEFLEKISHTSVAICGLGGLGSNIAISLARTGIGRLHLIDFDKVDISNLNRQQYAASQIGQYKTQALKSNLLKIAPYCQITTDCIKLSEENLTLLEKDHIICEAFDVAENKAMLVNGVMEQFSDKYVVAASGMAGLHSPNAINTCRISGRLYICGDGKSDVEKDEVLYAPRVALCAAHQANTVLRIIAGKFEI